MVFTRGPFIKVDKRPRKEKIFSFAFGSVQMYNTNTLLSSRGQQKKIVVLVTSLEDVPQSLFSLKKINFVIHDWLLAFWICIC